MNKVLAGVPSCESYLDDMVIYSSSWSKHIDHIRLRDASLTLNLAKCEFAKAPVTYLGKQVGQGQMCPVEAKVSAIADFPIPSGR